MPFVLAFFRNCPRLNGPISPGRGNAAERGLIALLRARAQALSRVKIIRFSCNLAWENQVQFLFHRPPPFRSRQQPLTRAGLTITKMPAGRRKSWAMFRVRPIEFARSFVRRLFSNSSPFIQVDCALFHYNARVRRLTVLFRDFAKCETLLLVN